MKRCAWGVGAAVPLMALLLLRGADSQSPAEERLWQYRNLGKAFYENPTTQLQAVDQFKKALELAPNSAREHVNYGLALLRAGRTPEGIAELEKAQKQDPGIPHTWFNLGIAFKKDGQYEKAQAQFEQMIRLVPDEPVSHYNLAVLDKLAGKREAAIEQFQIASRLNPNLAGPHFQLYNAYRQAGRTADAARELQLFQEIKKKTAGAAVPEDMEWSFYAEIDDPIEPRAAEPSPGAPLFQERQLASGFDPSTAGLAVLDADGDGRPDLLAWSARGIELFLNTPGKGLAPQAASGLQELRDIRSVAVGDFDNDGLPDLCVLTGSGAALYRNAKGRFARHPARLPAGRFAKAVWLDYDHDYDLDLFLLGETSVLARNNAEAGFSAEPFPFLPGRAVDAAVIDLVADTNGMDLAVSYADRPGVLYRDKLLGKYAAVPLEALPAGAVNLAAYDVDNDGWTDLAAAGLILRNRHGKLEPAWTGERATPVFADLENRGIADLVAGGSVFQNQGLAKWVKSSVTVPSGAAGAQCDFDGDGLADLALISTDGSLRLLHNVTPVHSHWARVALTGIKNPKLAPAAEVEVKAGSIYQKRIYHGVPLLFGLDSRQGVDTVRITWPNGLVQNEPNQPIDKPLAFQEAQRLSGSCPMIFTWNGSRFQFVTDVLGVAPLGASSGDGTFFPLDHDEYVQIPAGALVPADGRYEVRITEELREVSYLDQVKLVAVDHPAEVEIFTNDKFKSPPFPEFRLYGARRRVYPRSARDSAGRDVLGRLLHRDRRYPDGFRRDYAGAAELHHLDLDFGSAAPGNRAVLILNGWVDWADGSTFLGRAQAGRALILPYLQVKDSSGAWRTVVADMGIPAGKPKTIAVDLTGKFLSASREVRIVTNLCVYWDEIFLSEESATPPARLAELLPLSADLRFRGFSKAAIDAARRQPESFDYAQPTPVSMWNPTPGNYTRYGGVTELLTAVDDRMVIMGSGDEVRLLFEPPQSPLPPGWTRDFLLFVDGWAKDGDANTAYSQTVEPLPFHGMRQYGDPFPDDAVHRRYRQQYNTRPALRLLRPLISRVFRNE
ncbi:MAG TPA: FG-GAP-like repeat-containing protein [Bryobacteraceae bacterium]|nr:FG-GAP-like repeat-containing protein [Bryobacteraceae bacterium]